MEENPDDVIGYKEPGLPPGTLVYTGEERGFKPVLHCIRYGPNSCETIALEDPAALEPAPPPDGATWLHVCGIHDLELVACLGRKLNLHPLVLEDIVHPQQRPKLEEYDDHLFIVAHWTEGNKEEPGWSSEQIVIVLMDGLVLSFQESAINHFEAIAGRIHVGRGRIRKSGSAYLAYAILDNLVDHYFAVEDEVRNTVESIQEELSENHGLEQLQRIFQLRRDLGLLRGSIWPLRDLTSLLDREEIALIPERTRPFLRDLHDHCLQLKESFEVLREMVRGLQDLHLSLANHRMSSVMQVLSIIATIFIPLTFLAGLYGMNFKHMPELEWRWSYPVLLGVMGGVGVVLLLFFKRRRWL